MSNLSGSPRLPHQSHIRGIHNFISVTSCSASSNACTLSWRGMTMIRYGIGVRPDSPSYSSRQMGSSGRDRISNAQSNREIASHSSRSATCMPGQMRRLAEQPKKKSASAATDDERAPKTGMGKRAPRGMCCYAPCAERPMVPIHCVG
jgi:hypothetical protein